jgi:hypothetical protein
VSRERRERQRDSGGASPEKRKDCKSRVKRKAAASKIQPGMRVTLSYASVENEWRRFGSTRSTPRYTQHEQAPSCCHAHGRAAFTQLANAVKYLFRGRWTKRGCSAFSGP